MKAIALLVALLITVVGLVGVCAPELLLTAARYMITPAGLYVIAAVRVGIGILFILVAPISRTPQTLRAVGALVFLAGLATPLFGAEQARAIVDWGVGHGTAALRGAAGVVAAVGSFIMFAVATGRPA